MTQRPPERAELDALLDPMLGFAEKMLRERGEFYPFAVTMDQAGQIALVGGMTDSEHPDSRSVIELLAGGLRANAQQGAIRAAGICWDSLFTGPDGKKTDAIAMSLEHEAGDAAMVSRPYAKGRFGGWKFGDLVATAPGERRIFVRPG